jgi:hypothetical protein
MLRVFGAVAGSLVVTALALTLAHAVIGDVAWWREGVWLKTWLGIGVLTAIPTCAASRR